jgi:hypothetical protein
MNTYKIAAGKCEGKRKIWRHICRWGSLYENVAPFTSGQGPVPNYSASPGTVSKYPIPLKTENFATS